MSLIYSLNFVILYFHKVEGDILQTWDNCFDVSLTVHFSIILANDQLDAQIF
jgi:hypothetical protein